MLGESEVCGLVEERAEGVVVLVGVVLVEGVLAAAESPGGGLTTAEEGAGTAAPARKETARTGTRPAKKRTIRTVAHPVISVRIQTGRSGR